MIALPVIVRELRAEARSPSNYWLRVVTASLAITVFFVVAWSPFATAKELGERLFRGVNGLMFFSIWIIAPILTADCLSREKREGTLGLLFLTPLSALGVVSAKSFIHGVRALVLALVAFPIATAAMFWGGVAWREVVIAGLLNADALMLGLSAGILASSMNRSWSQSLALSLILASAFIFIFVQLCYFCHVWAEADGLQAALGAVSVEAVFVFCTGANGLTLTAQQLENLLSLVGMFSLVAALASIWVLRQAVQKVEQGWQDESLTVRQLWYRRVFCTPRFWHHRFRRRMQESLDRNPIGWLQHYSWNSRVVKWGWCGLFILFEGARGLDYSHDYLESQLLLFGLLLLGMSLSAAGSFIQERRSGAMELLLVSPLAVDQIIFGRIKGIWAQFVPALAVMALYFVLAPMIAGNFGHLANMLLSVPMWTILFLGPVYGVPMAGLYFSLRRNTFMSAWVMTFFVSLALPLVAGYLSSQLLGYIFYGALRDLNDYYNYSAYGYGRTHFMISWGWLFNVLLLESILAVKVYRRLKKMLLERTFPINLS